MNASVTASQMTRRMEDVGAGTGERASVIGRLRWCQQEKEAATWQRRRHQRGNDPADGAAAGSGGKQQGFAPPDAQEQLARLAATQSELVAADAYAIALPLRRRGSGRPRNGVSHGPAGLRVQPALQEAQLLGPPTRSGRQDRARAGGGKASASQRRVGPAPTAPKGVAGAHQVVSAMPAQNGSARFDVRAAARCAQAPPGGTLGNGARRGARSGMGASALPRSIGRGSSPAAFDGASPQARGLRVSREPLAIVRG